MKFQKFTATGSKDIRIRTFEFVAKTQFHCFIFIFIFFHIFSYFLISFYIFLYLFFIFSYFSKNCRAASTDTCGKVRGCVEGVVFDQYWKHFKSAYECTTKCTGYNFINPTPGYTFLPLYLYSFIPLYLYTFIPL